MSTRWRSRAVELALPMPAARRMWGRAWRVDVHHATRAAGWRSTVLLGAEPAGSSVCTPIGWCSMRWQPGAARAVIDRVGWNARGGATARDVWRAVGRLTEVPVAAPNRRGETAA